jgi:hypothetical protein
MLNIGASYYTVIVDSDGDMAPLADHCVRDENRMQTASVRRRGRRAWGHWITATI